MPLIRRAFEPPEAEPAARTAEAAGTHHAEDAAPPRERLSQAQARLWELEAHESSRGLHSFAIAYDLRGALDAVLLERALRAVAIRHLGLRVRIVELASQPWFEETSLPPALVVEHTANGDDRDAFEARLRVEAARPLDPTIGPAWRAVLFRESVDVGTLLLRFHHVIADRWSVAIFASDLAEAYAALAEGREPFADQAPLRRATHAVEEDDATSARHLAHWRAVFADTPEPLALPAVRGGQGFTGYAGERIVMNLDAATTASLRESAAAQGTTLFPLLLTAFAATLHAHERQEDQLICTPMIGRHRAGSRNVIGYFNNIAPLRLDLSGDPDAATIMSRVTRAARSAFEHQDLPFQSVAALPELAGVRLTRCLFAVQNIPGLELRLPDVRSSYRDVPNGTANFDLSVFLEERGDRLQAIVDYKTAVFHADVIESLLRRFFDVARLLAADPTLRLSALPRFHETQARVSDAMIPAARDDSESGDPELERRMIALWQDVFAGRSDVVIDAASHFFELGGDSMQAARLFARIDRELGRALPLAALFEAPTPRRLLNRMTDEKWQAPWSPLVAVQPYGHRPPLFFLAGGGGNVINYGILADCLSHEQPVYCLQARGLAPGEQPLAAVEEMADNYLEAIRRFRPRGPYLLAGHSLGAVVAYEIAQRVVREGDEVPLLALFDHPGPDIRLTRADWLRYHLINLSMLDRRDRVQYVVVGLSWRFRFLRALRRTVTGPARKTAPDHRIGWNSVEMLEHALRALRNYRIRPYPGRVTLFRARQGSPRILADPHGGWGRVAGAGVDVVEVPGTHLTMLTEPHVRTLGRAFADYLERLPSTAVQETR